MTRAQDIVDQILSDERYVNSRIFSERTYTDEPILRAGARKTACPHQEALFSEDEAIKDVDRGVGVHPDLHARLQQARARRALPPEYRKMRRMAGSPRRGGTSSWRLFYEQGKLMEDFEDDFDGECSFDCYFPTYEAMSDFQLRCYFGWRTRLRHGEVTYATLPFLFVHAYELLCGIGAPEGMPGLAELDEFAEQYKGISQAFDSYMRRWRHDYIVFHGLDAQLLAPLPNDFGSKNVVVLRAAERVLLDNRLSEWPVKHLDGMPTQEELLDALVALSRYRADRSRFVRENKEAVAQITCNVFARMVAHCNKRRKTNYIDGLFGPATGRSYFMFPSAVFWTGKRHEDVRYEASAGEVYICSRGFWTREYPCRRTDKSKELGALLHAIDARTRLAFGDAHPLKEKPLPKYQAKFVDEEIEAYLARKKAAEAAHIRIDRNSLAGIRNASIRTQEALLTEDDMDIEPAEKPKAAPQVVVEVQAQRAPANTLGLSEEHLQLLLALLDGSPLEQYDDMFLTLAADSINEALLDEIGDTVVEFDGGSPVLVEDYIQDVKDLLG